MSQTGSGQHLHGAVLVTDKLRTSLTRFAGVDGFASLLRRAVALASKEVPALQSVKVGADGRLEGLEHLGAGAGNGERRVDEGEAAVAVTAHLLRLLVTFIGEHLALRLVREAWPDESMDESHLRIEVDR